MRKRLKKVKKKRVKYSVFMHINSDAIFHALSVTDFGSEDVIEIKSDLNKEQAVDIENEAVKLYTRSHGKSPMTLTELMRHLWEVTNCPF